MVAVKFDDVKDGGFFYSISGDFVKINEFGAKRTEENWKTSKKFWGFSPLSTVYITE